MPSNKATTAKGKHTAPPPTPQSQVPSARRAEPGTPATPLPAGTSARKGEKVNKRHSTLSESAATLAREVLRVSPGPSFLSPAYETFVPGPGALDHLVGHPCRHPPVAAAASCPVAPVAGVAAAVAPGLGVVPAPSDITTTEKQGTRSAWKNLSIGSWITATFLKSPHCRTFEQQQSSFEQMLSSIEPPELEYLARQQV